MSRSVIGITSWKILLSADDPEIFREGSEYFRFAIFTEIHFVLNPYTAVAGTIRASIIKVTIKGQRA